LKLKDENLFSATFMFNDDVIIESIVTK
jgi:hypothetical protein